MGTFKISDFTLSDIESMRGFRPMADFESDGCTMAPDEIGAVDLRLACLFHDWAYACIRNAWRAGVSLSQCERDRRIADRFLHHNMITCGASRSLARCYFYRVRLWGFIAMEYDPPPARLTRWSRLVRLAISRYLPIW